MVGLVQRKEVDMTIMPLIQSYSRYAVGEYSPTIIYVPFGILSASDVSTSNVFGYILTFDWKESLNSYAVSCNTAADMTAKKYVTVEDDVIRLEKTSADVEAAKDAKEVTVDEDISYETLPDCIVVEARQDMAGNEQGELPVLPDVHQWGWELFGNLLYESSPRSPSQTTGRIGMTVWLLGVLVIANSFAGHLKSSMAVKNEPPQIDSVGDVVARHDLRPIIWKGSHYEAFISGSQSHLLRKLWRMVVRTNGSQLGRIMYRDENMREVVEGRAVFMVDHNSMQYHMAAFCRREVVPSFHFAREIIDEHRLSFLMSRFMPRDLHRRIYTRITWMYEGGLVSKWMGDELAGWQRCVRQTGGHSAEDLTINDTLATFVLWAIVMAIAAVALLVETLHPHSDSSSLNTGGPGGTRARLGRSRLVRNGRRRLRRVAPIVH
ncbi:uncharacterized protein LOC144129726 [Amblyomma americanum]